MKTLAYLVMLVPFTAISQSSPAYLEQPSPGSTPQIFAPDVISKANEFEFGSVFSEDGTEFYYAVDMDGRAEIRYTRLENNQWTPPEKLIHHDRYGYNDPFLSPDEQQLYFISSQPLDGTGEPKDIDIWYTERTEEGWSDPINAGPTINSDSNEYYISFTQTGTMYFSSNVNATAEGDYDIYSSRLVDEGFQTPQRLSGAINKPTYEADVFVAYDESYLIFCATRPGGHGRGDLYISFRQEDGTWGNAKNMGDVINTTAYEFCPFVTKDGKYFFYSSDKDIYWVEADIINTLRP